MSTSQRTGDVGDVFDEKYKIYGDMLFRLCMVYIGNYADAEEAMQEAFIKLLYKAPLFTDDEHEKMWLIRITINICKDKLKSFWRKNVVSINEMEFSNSNEDDLQLTELILKLPYKYRTAIHLYYFENYKVDEISEILHISKSAVKMRLKRGREILKFELEEQEYEPARL
jgi:RNA polymerase sigma factor (sigma-70 family)